MTATLLERVGSMDAEVNALIGSLRAGAGRLAADLTAVEGGMAELYGAASGTDSGAEDEQVPHVEPALAGPAAPPEQPVESPQQSLGAFEAALDSALAVPANEAPIAQEPQIQAEAAGAGADLDGARLIALNMALNGESRSDTERYLAENFELPDRLGLIDEVYAAIEG